MTLDRAIAAVILVVSLVYGYAAFTYALLPFERNVAFKPNTFPMALSIIVVILASAVLLSPVSGRTSGDASSGPDAQGTGSGFTAAGIRQAAGLIAAMVAYALALRPAGFLFATVAFLAGTGWILGERRLPVMLGVAATGALAIWYLVQEVLGIFLRPLPWFVS